jgi:hypothetical protein
MIDNGIQNALLPPHGRLSCSRCFPDQQAMWGVTTPPIASGWTIENNPCAWGSRNPRVLVLGFSKGANQTAQILQLPHDYIPFKGMRNNLTLILRKLGVLAPGERIDGRIAEREPDIAFGSLIRCSVSKLDSATGRYLKSGNIINALANGECQTDFASNCAQQFLSHFPHRLRLVVLLSNDSDYVVACINTLRAIHPDLRVINPVGYAVGHVLFVHVVHPSGASGRHVKDWLNGKYGIQAEKCRFAVHAVREHLPEA